MKITNHFGIFPFGVVRKLLYRQYGTTFCFMWKNALIMEMQMLAKYTVPYRLILSDALSTEQKTQARIVVVIFCVQMDACGGTKFVCPFRNLQV